MVFRDKYFVTDQLQLGDVYNRKYTEELCRLIPGL